MPESTTTTDLPRGTHLKLPRRNVKSVCPLTWAGLVVDLIGKSRLYGGGDVKVHATAMSVVLDCAEGHLTVLLEHRTDEEYVPDLRADLRSHHVDGSHLLYLAREHLARQEALLDLADRLRELCGLYVVHPLR